MSKMALLTGVLIMASTATSEAAFDPLHVADAQLFEALDLKRPGLRKVSEAAGRGDYEAAGVAWAEYFAKREKPTPHFSRETWAAFIRREFPQLVDPILAEADGIAGGDIGHAAVRLPVRGRKINWLHNPKKDTSYVSCVGSQWFMNYLGRAYLLTGDEKYAEAFAWIFESWYDHLPEIVEHQGGLGFNPVFRAYYPGIQARILTDNYYCLAASPSLTPDTHVKVMKQLFACASWLYERERRYRRGNQQVAAVLGLGIVGLVFPEFRDSEKWLRRCETRMKEHLRRDFFEDGGHRELCTQYHKTCLRDMGYVALTAERNGQPSFFRDREIGPLFEGTYDWLARLVMPTGETPALHSAVFSNDWAVHLLIAARYFKRPDFLWQARRFWKQGTALTQKIPFAHANFLVCEELDPNAFRKLRPKRPDYRSVHLDSSGFAVVRTGWEPEDRYLVFQYGWANTGHAYPAALAFCLEMNGELIATNPGSPRSYRHPAYKYCHTTRSHNLVTIGLRNYAGKTRLAPGGKLRTYADLPGVAYLSASQRGYKKDLNASHERSLLFIKDGPILVRDIIRGGEGHVAQWNFHTPLAVKVLKNRTATLKGRKAYRLCPAFPSEVTNVKIERHWEAVLPRDCQPGDCGKEIPVLRYEKKIGSDGVQFCAALIEGEGNVKAIDDRAFRIETSGAAYVVLYGDGGAESRVGDITTDAECACVEMRNGAPSRAWVINGKTFAIAGQSWLETEGTQTVELKAPR